MSCYVSSLLSFDHVGCLGKTGKEREREWERAGKSGKERERVGKSGKKQERVEKSEKEWERALARSSPL